VVFKVADIDRAVSLLKDQPVVLFIQEKSRASELVGARTRTGRR
jgi:hypothetical protein